MMDLGDEVKKNFHRIHLSGILGFRYFLRILHFIVSIWYFTVGIINTIESHLISSSLLKKYGTLDISKVRYLAIVIDSEEAHQTQKVIELLQWLADLGVKKVCLYDAEGVLKESKDLFMQRFDDPKSLEGALPNGHGVLPNGPLLGKTFLAMEFISSSDGKEAVAKAATFLFKKNYMDGNEKGYNITEPIMDDALKAVGSGGQEPDLLLIYAPARCLLGFPAWRTRYTEFVHMGSLKSKKYGSLIKAIHRFTSVRQNYGS